jgi:hypothetical protein
MARPKESTAPKPSPKYGTQIAFRANADLLRLIDREAAQMKAERPGLSVSRADVARDLIWRALKGRARRSGP